MTGSLDHTRDTGKLDELAALGPFFAVGSHPPGAPVVAPWRPFSELTGSAGAGEALRDRLATVSAAMAAQATAAGNASRAIEAVDPRVAASALHLNLAARLICPALGSAVLGDPVDMRLGGLWWQDELGGPMPLSVPAPAPVSAVSAPAARQPLSDAAANAASPLPQGWGQQLIDEVIGPVTDAVARLVPVSDRVLWGNVASAVNAAAAQVGRRRPDLVGDAWRIAAELSGSPRLGRESRPPGPRFRRTSCCLFYRIMPGPPAAVCGDCVLRELTNGRRP